MKLLAAFILFAAATTAPEIRYFRYERPLENTPAEGKQTCLALDANLFAHSEPGLADLRLYRDRTETPYVIQTPAPSASESEQAIKPLNLGVRAGHTVFDAAMPAGRYGDLQLDVKGQDFIATVSVSGSRQQAGATTKIGDYTIFDLTRQKLGRSTVLHLPLSDFGYLHFRIAGPLRPEEVTGISVEKAPSEQPAYVTVAESTRVTQKDCASIIEFTVRPHVPIDRIAFTPGASPANFSRLVTVEARPIPESHSIDSAEPPQAATATGNLLRVHILQNDRHIDQENLAVDPPSVQFDTPSKWTIAIDNGDNAPLVPASVRLEMLKRDLCFEASNGSYALYYGDPKLSPPRYDLGQFLIVRLKDAAQATARPEQLNPDYQPRPDDRPFTDRHPLLLWIALALVILILGAIAWRSARSTQPSQG